MKNKLLIVAILCILALSLDAQTPNKDQKIEIALSAAPASVAEGATVMEWDSRKILRQGSNEYICFPKMPGGQSYPMCFDEQFLKWFEAILSGEKPPPASKVSIGYFLQGVPPMSNEDPFATPEETANHVIAPGDPHIVVLFPDQSVLKGLPTNPKQGGPWVMFKDTPYIHLMIPAPSPVSK